jgi:protein-S-isoprenylcysteine O-methyltransferase Ste14
MEFFPDLQLGWCNGWLPLAVFYLFFALLMRSFPREVVQRLYAGSAPSTGQRILNVLGFPFDLAVITLSALTPLKIGRPVFLLGMTMYALGLLGFVWALFNFKDSPMDQPVKNGLYRYSRNPQWVTMAMVLFSIGIAVGSGMILLSFAVRIVCNHFRILGEEKYCLELYGEPYRQYMKRVPRYALFF